MPVNHLRLASHSGFAADASITDNGRVDIAIDETDPGRLAALLAARPAASSFTTAPAPPPPGTPGNKPRLNIVIQAVGSRGDVQPFIALGHVLRRTYGHRVRLVTHAVFRTLVEAPEPDETQGSDGGRLEFFDIGGGDPAELMSFMVQNGARKEETGGGGDGDDDDSGGGVRGLMPRLEAYTNGDIARRRGFIEAVLRGCWRSIVDDGDGGGSNEGGPPPFVADAIVANPPSFAHIHLAESLGVPLHIMFTMPWTPTWEFPHPLANITWLSGPATTPSPALYGLGSFVSYTMVECLTWQGLGDIINRFRIRDLGLEPLSPLLAVAPFHPGGLLGRLRVPTTYCWSPALLPKPADWGDEITVAGYFFSATERRRDDELYTPSPDLAAFLSSGPPPIYIGFGSIVVDDPADLTRTVLEAVGQLSGVRAIVSRGWGGLGGSGGNGGSIDSKVFFLTTDCPHEWLFPRMACVVHHGGAGTTAAGLRYGVPTVVVPFFGDQPFWGSLVASAGAGPEPIPFPRLTAERLSAAIKHALLPDTKAKARALRAKIGGGAGDDNGAVVGARVFHQHLNLPDLSCDMLPDRLAVWRCNPPMVQAASKASSIRLSALAAAVLVSERKLAYSDLRLFRAREYHIQTDDQPREPISAASAAIVGDLSSIAMAVADFPRDLTSATVTVDSVTGAYQSVGRIVTTGLQSPLHFCMGLARGFHNAPLLYGDDTVRPLPGRVASASSASSAPSSPPPVTNLGSGIRAASTAFGLGLYDGITGLVTQPLRGAAKDAGSSGRGLVAGFAKGIGGVVLKPTAGAWAVPAYVMQGMQAELRGLMGGRMAKNGLDAARMKARQRQGEMELAAADGQTRLSVVERWERLVSTE